jgi:siroheme synthase-like protein
VSYTKYHPVFLNLHARHCLVVGGGAIALEKTEGLIAAGATVTVVSPALHEKFLPLRDKFQWIAREFREEDVQTAFLSIGATDDLAVNRAVFEAGERLGRLANSVDDPHFCNFIMAATVESGPVQVAVSSAGCSPALAQKIRDRIAHEIISEETGALAEFLGSWRSRVKDKIEGYGLRKKFWESVLESSVPHFLAEGNASGAEHAMGNLLDKASNVKKESTA